MKTFCGCVKIFCLLTLLVSLSSCAPSYYESESEPSTSAEDLARKQAEIIRQVEETLHRAEAHVRAGQRRAQEGASSEAQYEFNQARLLMAQELEPRLSYVNQVRLQGGVGIQSMQMQSTQLSGIKIRIKAIDEVLEREKLPDESVKTARVERAIRQSQPTFRSIAPPSSYGSTKSLSDRFFTQSDFRQLQLFDARRQRDFEDDIERNIAILLRQGRVFRQCLLRADSYFPQVTSILSDEGVPEALAYVALLESGYQPEARSSSGRAGLWQLSPSIAREYGLQVSALSDERLQVHASTRAFARYVSQLYQQYGSWGKVLDVFSLDSGYLARLFAAGRIANNPWQYGVYVDLHNMTGYYDLLRGEGGTQRFSEPDVWGPPAY